jgi:hypothetical protein
MSSKISDACTKAAGEVYVRALLQYVYAGLVVVGAIVGQRWGVGGVAVAVSIAMGVNWLSMAWLGRSVTGLSWPRFLQAQLPAGLLAVVVGAAAALVAHWARGAHLGTILVLAAAGLAAVVVTLGAAKLAPQLFLGSHGLWAVTHGGELIRGGGRRRKASRDVSGDQLASAGEPSTE